jgi:hypothetical protein
MSEFEYHVPQDRWDFVKGKMRLKVREVLHGQFDIYGQKADLPIAEDALMDIFDAGFDALRGADKPIMARNWRPMLKND